MRRESADSGMSMSGFYKKLAEPSSILVKNAKFVMHENGALRDKSVYIEGRHVAAIGSDTEIARLSGDCDMVIDASGCIVMPGLINTHTHLAMSLLRGFAEDLRLHEWLEKKIWPAEAKLTPHLIEVGAAVSVAEAMLSGTTCALSMYFYDSSGSEVDAVEKLGMRGVLAHSVFDWTMENGMAKLEEMARNRHASDDGRIRVAASSHSPYTCGPEVLKEVEQKRTELNEKYGATYPIISTIHVAESADEAFRIKSKYGVDVNDGIAAYLHRAGLLNSYTVAAHSTHLTDTDYSALSSTGASVASCPTANLKLGMGVADIGTAVACGINVGLGTDGPASNNSLDMFEAMKFASILQKSKHGDTTVIPSKKAFEMATLNGAKALHQSDIGSISVGKRADLLIVDASKPNASPMYDVYNHIAYSAKAGDVKHVIVDGRITVYGGDVTALDMEKLRLETERAVQEINAMS